ncbi:hypothetical protein PG997_012878 [Apiospora hydei]|uniref:Uncharacterized protein n=1 Tax=Apiospora hydei TaxID=1337664 RepID=A0ABR1V4M0_9PEZI
MGGTEGTTSSSGDDGGRSGYDVTRAATVGASTKFEFFVAFGIMMGVDDLECVEELEIKI